MVDIKYAQRHISYLQHLAVVFGVFHVDPEDVPGVGGVEFAVLVIVLAGEGEHPVVFGVVFGAEDGVVFGDQWGLFQGGQCEVVESTEVILVDVSVVVGVFVKYGNDVAVPLHGLAVQGVGLGGWVVEGLDEDEGVEEGALLPGLGVEMGDVYDVVSASGLVAGDDVGVPVVHADLGLAVAAAVFDVAEKGGAVVGVPVPFQYWRETVLRQASDEDGAGTGDEFQGVCLGLIGAEVIDGVGAHFVGDGVEFAFGVVAAAEQEGEGNGCEKDGFQGNGHGIVCVVLWCKFRNFDGLGEETG